MAERDKRQSVMARPTTSQSAVHVPILLVVPEATCVDAVEQLLSRDPKIESL